MCNIVLCCVLSIFLLSGCGTEAEQTIPEETETVSMIAEKKEETVMESVLPEAVLDWEDSNLTIPGLNEDLEIWYFTDSHIIVENGTEDEQTVEYAAQRTPTFANELGVTSDEIFSLFITEANEKEPDLILFGGDIIDFPSDANISFIKEELDRLTIPYIFAMGNHDWTFPWAYMNEEGTAVYRPMLESYMYGNFENAEEGLGLVSVTGNTYYVLAELEDFAVLSIDDSSNQVAPEALDGVKQACSLNKPVILVQHVPFSTEDLIVEAKKNWANPVTLGMQVHGGIAPNESSAFLWEKTHEENAMIKAVLAGHVHFSHEEALSEETKQIVGDAAFKGKVTELKISGQYPYFCDKFMLTVDDKQYDLSEIAPEMSSVSELLPITKEQLFILGRVDESTNAMLIYDFKQDEFVFHEQGSTLCWVQDEFDTVRYLKDNVVYDLEGNVIYETDQDTLISLITYVEKDFMISVTDRNHENPREIWIE